jgi:hypothetical protein
MTISMKRLPAFVLGLALLARAGDVCVPLKDGSVLRGERVEDAAIADRGVRLRTGGVTLFVPWDEMTPEAAADFRAGRNPAAPSANPPVAPSPWGDETALPPLPDEALWYEPYAMQPGEAPELPACCDPRF